MAGRTERRQSRVPKGPRGPELVWPGKRRAARPSPVAPSSWVVLEAHAPACGAASQLSLPLAREALAREQPGSPSAEGWRNRLIRGENGAVLKALLAQMEGQVDLVYLDPPFATGNDFAFQATVGEDGEARNGFEALAYADSWGRGRERWFSMLYERLRLARSLLSERGTIYLHLDWSAGHHARVLLDEVFGEESSLGEIVWAYGSPSGGRAAGRKLVKAHDILFVAARRYGSHRFKQVYLPYSEKYLRDWFRYRDPDGRRYRKRWRRDREGRSYVEKQYLDESPGIPASTVWTDIQQVYADPRAYREGMTSEITGFPTQKPLRLLERILAISTEPGDLVADLFAGSGTTLVAAERMGRRWIGCDVQALAIHTARKRLLAEPNRQAFEIVELRAEGARSPAPMQAEGLEAQAVLERGVVEVRLRDFPCPAGVPRAVRERAKGFEDFVDYWAVDWDFQETFRPGFREFRTRKDRRLALVASEPLSRVGARIRVMAVDLLGNARCCTLARPSP